MGEASINVVGIKYDVRKTDSLVSPVIGLASFTLEVNQTSLVATKEEAESLTEFIVPKSSTSYDVNVAYIFKDGEWRFKDGTFVAIGRGLGKAAFTQESISNEPSAIPFAALSYWIH